MHAQCANFLLKGCAPLAKTVGILSIFVLLPNGLVGQAQSLAQGMHLVIVGVARSD